MSKLGQLRVGTSGWQYDHWAGVFYPESIRKSDWLTYYTRHFDTVEVNNTFYHLPQAETFESWRKQAPAGFCYVLKFSRYGSHLKHLAEPADYLAEFLERAGRLGEHLGPILVQLPPKWSCDVERLAGFLAEAPREQRWAFEFRHPSWLRDDVYAALREHNAALCIHDLIADHPRVLTANWTYLRYHGPQGGNYSPQALSAQAAYVKELLAKGIDVFAFFNNDAHGYAPANAADLRRFIGVRGPFKTNYTKGHEFHGIRKSKEKKKQLL